MTEGNLLRHLIRFSFPLLLANCLQCFYTVVDAFVVGHFGGVSSLAAVSTCGDIIQFYTAIAMGISTAGQIIIAQYVGKDDRVAIGHTIGNLVSSLVILALALSVLCCCAVNFQLGLIHLPAESVAEGRQYIVICAFGMLFSFGYNAASAVFRGLGDGVRPLVFVGIASVVNLLLDLLFVIVFHMGAAGAALATVIGQFCSLLFSVLFLCRHRNSLGFSICIDDFRLRREYLVMLLKLGLPIAIQIGSAVISIIYVGAQINLAGVAATAANGVVNKLETFVRIATISVGAAGSTMIAQNIAAKKYRRVKEILGCTLLITGSWSILCSVAIYFFPVSMFSLFSSDPSILSYAPLYAVAGVLNYMSYCCRSTANALVNGIGFANMALISGLLDSIVARIGLCYLLGYTAGLGLTGFWLGSSIAGYVPFLVGGIYYLTGRWKTHRLITGNN